MWAKWIVILFLVAILYCLGGAAFYLVARKKEASFVKALTWRIVISFILFIALFCAYYFGWMGS